MIAFGAGRLNDERRVLERRRSASQRVGGGWLMADTRPEVQLNDAVRLHSITACEVKGTHARDGACPVHRGDACLRVFIHAELARTAVEDARQEGYEEGWSESREECKRITAALEAELAAIPDDLVEASNLIAERTVARDVAVTERDALRREMNVPPNEDVVRVMNDVIAAAERTQSAETERDHFRTALAQIDIETRSWVNSLLIPLLANS